MINLNASDQSSEASMFGLLYQNYHSSLEKCSKGCSKSWSGLQKVNLVTFSSMVSLLRTVYQGCFLSALRLCVVITFFAILLKLRIFALFSVSVCLAFLLLHQTIFQELKEATSTEVHFSRMVFKLLHTPMHTLKPTQTPCCDDIIIVMLNILLLLICFMPA